jgi:hypothetical protein
MGEILRQLDGGAGARVAVRCPMCGAENVPMRYCRHVRWTFDQGDPLDFARFAIETSPYTHRRGVRTSDIPATWWIEHGEWVAERVHAHFVAADGYVFGDPADVDNLVREIWNEVFPADERAPLPRHAPAVE